MENSSKVDELLEDYRKAYRDTLVMRGDFAKKPGYVREKTDEEKAYREAYKVFGEFVFGQDDVMVGNTNNGKGVVVTLPEGKTHHIKNQKQLFDIVVRLNKKNGGFYDEQVILESSMDDYNRLKTAQDLIRAIQSTLRDVVKNPKEVRESLAKIEQEVREEVYGERKNDFSLYREFSEFSGGKKAEKKPPTFEIPKVAGALTEMVAKGGGGIAIRLLPSFATQEKGGQFQNQDISKKMDSYLDASKQFLTSSSPQDVTASKAALTAADQQLKNALVEVSRTAKYATQDQMKDFRDKYEKWHSEQMTLLANDGSDTDATTQKKAMLLKALMVISKVIVNIFKGKGVKQNPEPEMSVV